MPDSNQVRLGAFELDLDTGELEVDGHRQRLQAKPLQLLALLIEHPGEVVSRDEVRQRLWGEEVYGDFDHGINVAVAKVREALGDSADHPRFVETLPRKGYRLITSVEPAGREAIPAETTGGRSWLLAAAVALAAATVLLGLLELWDRANSPEQDQLFRSLAVLPFENVSSDSEEQYLADGFTESLITELGKIGSLRVISSQSVMQFRSSELAIPEIASQLRVGAVVEGSVLRTGERIRVTAQLVAAGPERHLWAESYEQELADVLDLQREIARAIAREVRVTLSPEELRRLEQTTSVVPAAYDAYLKGRYQWRTFTELGMRRAIEYFEEAIAIDPDYGAAHAWKANCWSMLCWYGFEDPGVAFGHAEKAAMRALETGREPDAALVAMSAVKSNYWWDLEGALNDTSAALELNPNNSLARNWHSWTLASAGLHGEALEEIRRAREVDPLSVVINTVIAIRLFDAGRYPEAERQFKGALEMDPYFLPALLFLGMTHEQLGELPEAIEVFEKAVEVTNKGSTYQAALAHGYALSDRREEALVLLGELEERFEREYVEAVPIAAIHVALEQPREAFQWLERGYDQRAPGMARLNLDPRFDPVRDDEGFVHLLRRIGYPVVR